MGYNFNFEEMDKNQGRIKTKMETYEESIDVKYEHVYQQFQNDIYAEIENGKCFNFKYIEESLLRNILGKFNRTNTAKILGVSLRTVRNKINKYELKDIRPN